MSIIKFYISNDIIDEEKIRTSDTIRMAFFQEDAEIFAMLNYEDDFTFLEPTLFFYFLSDFNKAGKIPLIQCILGYIPAEKGPATVSLIADRFGMINLPNLGYIRSDPYAFTPVDLNKLDNLIPINLLKTVKFVFAYIPLIC